MEKKLLHNKTQFEERLKINKDLYNICFTSGEQSPKEYPCVLYEVIVSNDNGKDICHMNFVYQDDFKE